MYTKSLSLALTLAIALTTLGYVNPASAAKPDCDKDSHPSCKTGDGDSGSNDTYSVIIDGPVSTVDIQLPSDSWGGGPKGVSLGISRIENTRIVLSSDFISKFGLEDGRACFGNGLKQFTPTQAFIRDSTKPRVEKEAWFWFEAEDSSAENVVTIYLLQLFGDFTASPNDPVWPPEDNDQVWLTMDEWVMRLENGQKELRDSACLGEGPFVGEGPFDSDVSITVTRTGP